MNPKFEHLTLERSVFLVSVDVEFAWGFADILETHLAKRYIAIISRRSRKNMADVLKICEKLEIPMTFGFVGRLLVDNESSNTSIWHAKDIFQRGSFKIFVFIIARTSCVLL